ncbi:MAG: hypothetical protein AAGE01_14680 [Pseudomonadota bacterium]
MATPPSVITTENLTEFFHDSIDAACERQALDLEDESRAYLVRLLEHFIAPAALGNRSHRAAHRPLALLFQDAVEARSDGERRDALRQVGDVALFVAGFFPGWLERRTVDVDYYVGMGGTAYGALAELHAGRVGLAARLVFRELADKFAALVALFDGLIAGSRLGSGPGDLLRQHELWLRSDGALYGHRLAAAGILDGGLVRH